MSECQICGDDEHSTQRHHIEPLPAPDQDGLLPQHRRCQACRQVTHAWDHQPCGSHTIPGLDLPVADAPPVTPPRDRSYDLQALARRQAEEARAVRGPGLDSWFSAHAEAPHEQM